jgi:hypothetical protein
MSWSYGVRVAHRWLSIFFTLAVVGNFGAMALGPVPDWLTYLPLFPLLLMLLSGLYLFALPYLAKGRRVV